jgi:hypothetical protein
MSQLRMKILLISAIIAILAFATLSSSLAIRQEDRASIRKQNVKDAEALEEKFKTLTPDSPCEVNDQACIGGAFAKCTAVQTEDGKIVNKYSIQPCNGKGLSCFALPLVLKRGTSLVCSKYQNL